MLETPRRPTSSRLASVVCLGITSEPVLSLESRTDVAPLLASQQGAAVALMLECGLSLGGYGGEALANAYCHEALARPDRLLILLATNGAGVGGFLVVLRAPWTFWRGFLARHPLLAVRMALFHLIRASGPVVPASGKLIPFGWDGDSPERQRILMIAVSTAHRRQGLAGALYQHLFQFCPGRSWALVDRANSASLALHQATGWSIEGEGDPILATRERPLTY